MGWRQTNTQASRPAQHLLWSARGTLCHPTLPHLDVRTPCGGCVHPVLAPPRCLTRAPRWHTPGVHTCHAPPTHPPPHDLSHLYPAQAPILHLALPHICSCSLAPSHPPCPLSTLKALAACVTLPLTGGPPSDVALQTTCSPTPPLHAPVAWRPSFPCSPVYQPPCNAIPQNMSHRCLFDDPTTFAFAHSSHPVDLNCSFPTAYCLPRCVAACWSPPS